MLMFNMDLRHRSWSVNKVFLFRMTVTAVNGKALLKSWLKRVMKIKLTDGRTVVGVFMCTDSECNLILGQCREYRNVGDGETASDDLNSEEPRILGLAMVPGHHIVSISVDVSEPTNETSAECGINL